MKVKPILNPLQGERVVGVDPPLKPSFEADWHRRLNLYTGRALSDIALTIEQDGRAGRLAICGQVVSPGVVRGLEIEFDNVARTPTEDDTRTETFFYKINSGFGIAASGEDVIVPRRLEIDVEDARIFAPTRILRPQSPRPINPVPILTPQPDRAPMEARMLGPRLGELSDESRALLPRVGILVLQPVVAEVVADMDDSDPCEQDPQSFAFDDWQMIDGARLILYAWPTEWAPIPPSDRWRNRLAYTIFRQEASLADGELLPWEEVGVPIALVAFDDGFKPLFVDRYSVARSGGKPKRRTSLTPGGSVFMWQARLQQFAEQISDPRLADKSLPDIAQMFRFLPPAGLLPEAAVEFIFSDELEVDPLARDHFFPSNYTVKAVPVPIEQLDVAIEASASLAPLDTFTGEQVQLLVPVPEIYYHPQLLKKERVDQRFQEAINEFTARETEQLFRRKDLRSKEKLIRKSVTGKEPEYADPDPDGAITLDPEEDSYGTNLSSTPPSVERINALKGKLRGMGTFMLLEVDNNLDRLGLEAFIRFLEEKINRADDKIDFGFLNAQTNIYRIRQNMLGSTDSTRLAAFPSLAEIAKGDSALVTRDDVVAFKERLKPSPVTPAQPTTPPPPAAPIAAKENLSIRRVSGSGSKAMLTDSLLSREVPQKAKLDVTKIATVKVPTSELLITATSGATELFKPTSRAKAEVVQQSPIIGEFIDFRTATVAARLRESESTESRKFAVNGKHQVISDLINLDINLDGLEVPGIVDLQSTADTKPNITFDRFKDSASRAKILQDILNGVYDPVPENADEGALFSVAVRALDNTIGILRKAEGRIQAYRIAVEACRDTLEDLQILLAKVAQRLQAIDDELAEARHDLAVASALLVEEQARVKAINNRRRLVVENHVSFLAYRRPRTTDLLADVPVRPLDPGLTEAPIPACLGRDVAVPPDLRATVELLRQVPIKWLVYVRPLLDRLDRLDIIQETVRTSVTRAQFQVQAATSTPGLYSKAIDAVLTAQYAVVARQRVQIANFDLGEVFEQNWQVIRERANEAVSLAALIEAGHGRSDVAAQATRELNDLTHIAACLYGMFSNVLPAVRLDWAERLSQFDAPVNLRNLSSLPHWGEKGGDGEDLISFLDRRQMQILTDWLYGRVDPIQAEAVSLIDDLVRICILLASHAPVNQIISGHTSKPATVTKGGRLELVAADRNKVRVGMHVLMYKDNQVVARGVVDDLSSSHVAAQVLYTATASVLLPEKARVEFGDPDSFDRATIKVLKR